MDATQSLLELNPNCVLLKLVSLFFLKAPCGGSFFDICTDVLNLSASHRASSTTRPTDRCDIHIFQALEVDIYKTNLLRLGASEPFLGANIPAQHPLHDVAASDTGNASIRLVKGIAVAKSVVGFPGGSAFGQVVVVGFALNDSLVSA